MQAINSATKTPNMTAKQARGAIGSDVHAGKISHQEAAERQDRIGAIQRMKITQDEKMSLYGIVATCGIYLL